MSSTVNSFRFFVVAVVISLLSLRDFCVVLTGEKSPKSALLLYTCGRLHSRFGDKRDGENENEKKRFWQVAFAPEFAALEREGRVIE
jgi:hypothetical protein|tara:strand:+ start:1090 stop:1350 length:261 start_codon:yes stop_codon:yes gene_type:complete